jgi:hypothetical protein
MVCAPSISYIYPHIFSLPLTKPPTISHHSFSIIIMPQIYINIEFPDKYPPTMPTITLPPNTSTLFLQAIPFMNFYIHCRIQAQTMFHYIEISQRYISSFSKLVNSLKIINQSRFTKGDQIPNSPISHRDAATLHYINNYMGHLDAEEWENFLITSMENKFSSLNKALVFLQAAYMMEPHKENFWNHHNQLWRSLIWNTYRDTLFHEPFTPTFLVYKDKYNISNSTDITDPFLPFHNHLAQGFIPFISYQV